MADVFYIHKSGGIGGFLDPPEYPTHTASIQEGPRNNPRAMMSLESTESWIPEPVRAEARQLLASWHDNKPPIDREDIQDWIAQVLGYFRGCYRGPGSEPECWNVSSLRIITKPDEPLPPVDEHAGVHLIRKFYPDWTPTEDDFKRAYWGKKGAE